jgi:hypothetical protein
MSFHLVNRRFRVLANEVSNEGVGKRAVHVAEALEIHEDLLVGIHKGVNVGVAVGRGLFAIRAKRSERFRKFDVQGHGIYLARFLALGNRPADSFAWWSSSGKTLMSARVKARAYIVP